VGRPKKEKSEQRQQIGFRLHPGDRQRLEQAATRARRSIPQEVEERIIASLNYEDAVDGPTRELLKGLVEEIATIQNLTGKRWHKDAITWAAVHQMFRQGPLSWVRPDKLQDDETVSAAWQTLYKFEQRRAQIARDLAAMGLAVLEKPVTTRGLMGVFHSRDSERKTIEAVEDEQLGTQARALFDEMLALDAEIETAGKKHFEAAEPYLVAERTGRKIYQMHRRKLAAEAMQQNKPFFWSDIVQSSEFE